MHTLIFHAVTVTSLHACDPNGSAQLSAGVLLGCVYRIVRVMICRESARCGVTNCSERRPPSCNQNLRVKSYKATHACVSSIYMRGCIPSQVTPTTSEQTRRGRHHIFFASLGNHQVHRVEHTNHTSCRPPQGGQGGKQRRASCLWLDF